jgi:hypothetical protein
VIAVGGDEKLATPGTAWLPITQNCVVLHHYDIKSRRAFRERIRRETSQRAGGSGAIRRVSASKLPRDGKIYRAVVFQYFRGDNSREDMMKGVFRDL